jgi:hypothetical protein
LNPKKPDFSASLASLAPSVPSTPSPLISALLFVLDAWIRLAAKPINKPPATKNATAQPIPIPTFAPVESFPLSWSEPAGGEVEDGGCVLEAVADVFEEVDFGFTVEEGEAEAVVEEAVAATTNISPYAFAPVESVSPMKNFLPGTANTPGVQE